MKHVAAVVVGGLSGTAIALALFVFQRLMSAKVAGWAAQQPHPAITPIMRLLINCALFLASWFPYWIPPLIIVGIVVASLFVRKSQ